MKFGKAVALMIVTLVVVIIGLWSNDFIRQEYYNYRYEQKIDQVYEQFLEYGPKFWGNGGEQSQSYYKNSQERKEDFLVNIKNLYRDMDDKKIYQVDIWQDKQLITGADYDTFTPLFSGYSRDKNYVYHFGERTMYDVNKNPRRMGQFIVDDEYVYIAEDHQIMTGADAGSFRLVRNNSGNDYARDKNTYRKGLNIIDMPVEVTFDDEFIYIPSENAKIPRHGRDPWDVYQMVMKGDV